MKKILVLCGCVIFAVACQKQDMNGCDKDDSKNEQVNVNLNAGESFVYEIPSSDGAANISTNAKHASLSRVSVVPSTGASNYEYVSIDNFTGSDEVSVTVDPTKSNQANTQGSCSQNNNSGCGGSHHNSCGNSNNSSCGNSSQSNNKNTKSKVITFHFSVKCRNK